MTTAKIGRSDNMRRIKSKGMLPELAVRSAAHRMGYRFRLHRSDLPGTPDLVFIGARKAIFVHGCFWHGHDDPACNRSHTPRSNEGYWWPKLARNKERDRRNITALEASGWRVLVIWECETRDAERLKATLTRFLIATGHDGGTHGDAHT
ncbi:MAG: very short patch repair endonuclease [Roseiarcus sp.]